MISENTKAVLLLTTFFNNKEVKQYKPLTDNGYGYLACWLGQNGFKPNELLNPERFDSIFEVWDNPLSHSRPKKTVGFAKLDQTIADITYERLNALINRGASLSIALDKWTSAGIWVVDRQHPNYPKAVKAQLKHKCPALFFGVGNIELLGNPSVGFVGSRDCNEEDIAVTQRYVEKVNQNGFQVVSGAAKGIDSEAMLASINNGNTAVGIVADSLFRASGSGQWRQALRNNRLALISPFYPEAGFTPKNAMARNKFIYMLSRSTMVVCSAEKGGTWEGAKEDLKHGWVPLLVSTHATPLQAGNQALLDGTGITKRVIAANTVSLDSIDELLTAKSHSSEDLKEQIVDIPEKSSEAKVSEQPEATPQQELLNQGDFFSNEEKTTSTEQHSQKVNSEDDSVSDKPSARERTATKEDSADSSGETIDGMPLLSSFYQQLKAMIQTSNQETLKEDDISKSFPEFEVISKTALSKWLKQLVDLELITRPNSRKKEFGLPKSTDVTQ